MNDVRAKTRLLSANIGENPSRAEEEGKSTLWQAISELSNNFKGVKVLLGTNLVPSIKPSQVVLEKQT